MRTSPNILRQVGLTVQLIPLAVVAVLLFLVSKPPDNPNGVPGVTGAPDGPPWLFPYSIALGLVGLGAIVSSKAAAAAAALALVAFAYFLQYIDQKPPEILWMSVAAFFAVSAVVLIVGWLIQNVAGRRLTSRGTDDD